MEQRIKIVWIFSIASILLITCGQVYWLRNQYQYMNDEQINGIYDCILQTTQQYDSIRTPQPKKVLSNTNMFFYHLSKSIDLEKRTTIDELILGVLKGRDLESLGQKNIETLKIEQQDSASTDDKEREAKRRKWALALDTLLPEERLIAKDSFKINMSDKDAPNLNSIINLYRLELDVPFALQQFDSLLAIRLDEQTFTTHLVVSEDSIYQWNAELKRQGTLFNPYIEVMYPYNPLKRQFVLVSVKVSPHVVLVRMGWQLVGSTCLIFLLGLCLLFQIKTILKQRRIDELRKSFVNTMIHELKRPVQALKMCIAFLNDKSMRTDEKAMDEVIHDSMSELDNLSAYLSKLRDMTRADDEHTQLSVRTFDIKTSLEKLVRLYHVPEGKDVAIETHFSSETLVTADPVHVSNIISNLIENAVKYSGKSVHIVVDCLLQDHQLTIRVSDDGIGIPVSEQNRVFDKFYRGSKKEGYEVTYAGNGKIALEQFPLIKPDLVLLDINMPGYNGFEVAERIREMDKHVLIFFLSDRSDKADRLQGFQLKANDYLAKPFYPEELTARIRERFTSQLSGVAEDEMYAFGHSVFNYSTNEIRTGNSKVLITSRQADILRLLALNVNKTVSRDTLLDAVWGTASYANSLALNVQMSYLRRSLKNDPSVRIESLMKKGYMLAVL